MRAVTIRAVAVIRRLAVIRKKSRDRLNMFEISFFPKGFIWVAHPQAASVTLKDVAVGHREGN
jgi:hypothetical protein